MSEEVESLLQKSNLTKREIEVIKLRFGFYGTYKLCDDIVKILNETIGLPLNKITTQKDANVSFITFGGEQDIINFCNYIYYSKDVICLNRKKEKFVNYLNKK